VPIAIVERKFGWDSTDVTGPASYTITSWTPAAGSGVLVLYSSREATTAPKLTPANCYGGTWAELGGGQQTDGISAVGAWYIPSADGSSSAITMGVPTSVVNIGMGYSVLEITGHDPAGMVVTTVYGPTGTTSTTIGLAASAPSLANASNAQIFFGATRQNAIPTGEAGWTTGTGASGTGPNYGTRAEWTIGAFDSSPTFTIASARWQSMYIEIAVAPAAGGYSGLWVPGMHRNHIGSMQTQGRA